MLKKKFTEANFSNLVSYLLYAYQKKSTEKLLAKSILWAKLDMRILQRLALNIVFVDSERTVLLGLSLQPVRSSKNLFFVIFQAYVTRAKRKRDLVVAVICALDT